MARLSQLRGVRPSFMIETFCIVAVVHEPRPVHCIPDFLLQFSTYPLNQAAKSECEGLFFPTATFPHIEISSPPTTKAGAPGNAIYGGNEADTTARTILLGANRQNGKSCCYSNRSMLVMILRGRACREDYCIGLMG